MLSETRVFRFRLVEEFLLLVFYEENGRSFRSSPGERKTMSEKSRQ